MGLERIADWILCTVPNARSDFAFPGVCTWQGAQNAILNPPKARHCCNPPQSAIRHADHATSPQALEPGTALAQ
eukprot:584844-Alexandrium_andersonii.AAC.1